MGRFTVGILLLSAYAGCGSQAKSSSATPIVDPQRANAEVSGYVKLAREYLSRKEFDKAVQTLERAVAIENATDKREATELLASVLPLTFKTDRRFPISNAISRWVILEENFSRSSKAEAGAGAIVE